MIVRARKNGDSFVITLPPAFVHSVGVQQGDYLKIAEDHIEVVKKKRG